MNWILRYFLIRRLMKRMRETVGKDELKNVTLRKIMKSFPAELQAVFAEKINIRVRQGTNVNDAVGAATSDMMRMLDRKNHNVIVDNFNIKGIK